MPIPAVSEASKRELTAAQSACAKTHTRLAPQPQARRSPSNTELNAQHKVPVCADSRGGSRHHENALSVRTAAKAACATERWQYNLTIAGVWYSIQKTKTYKTYLKIILLNVPKWFRGSLKLKTY